MLALQIGILLTCLTVLIVSIVVLIKVCCIEESMTDLTGMTAEEVRQVTDRAKKVGDKLEGIRKDS